MARLPVEGADDGAWGGILNEFLEVEHNPDGTLKNNGTLGAYAPLVSPIFTGTVTVPTPSSANAAVTKQYVDNLLGSKADDSDVVKLTGDQTVAGNKVFTNQVLADYSNQGTVTALGFAGGTIQMKRDASHPNAKIQIWAADTPSISMGNGTQAPDTTFARVGANNLGFGGARLSSIANPVDPQDAVPKVHLDNAISPPKNGQMVIRPALDEWFDRYKAATAASPTDLVIISDSIFDIGQETTNPATTALISRTLNQLAGLRDADAVPSSIPDPVHAQGVSSPTATSTEGARYTGNSLGHQGSLLTSGQVLTHAATCTGFSLAYRTEPGWGTMVVRDGPGGTILASINCDDAAKSGNVWHSGTLSNASHTLHITASGGSVCPEIIVPTRGNRVRVWPSGQSGTQTGQYVTDPHRALELIDTLAANDTLGCVLIATGTNGTSADYATDMPALVNAVQSRTDASVAVWFPYISAFMQQAAYDAKRPVADTLGVPIIDATFVADRTPTVDGVHPADLGRQMIADQVSVVLSGDPIGGALRTATNSHRVGRGTLANSELGEHGLTVRKDTTITRSGVAEFSIGSPLSILLGQIDGSLALRRLKLNGVATTPPGPNAVGDLMVINDVLSVCIAAGSPGTWEAISGNNISDFIIDEDDMASDSDTKVPTQQSVKSYTDKKGVLAYDEFTTSGTWTKPAGAKVVEVFVVGGGGGGGKGHTAAEGGERNGGGGGGAGGAVIGQFDASVLGSTETVTIGTGGAGGTTTGGFDNAPSGTATSFGSHVQAGGGTGGAYGGMVLGPGTNGIAGASSLMAGAGGASLAGAGAFASHGGGNGHVGGGGGGSGRLANNGQNLAGAGGGSSAGAGGASGTTTDPGGNGVDGTATNGGSGGGGGGKGQPGGNGGFPGGGGGGGGANVTADGAGGNGGAGANGKAIIITYG